MYRSCGRSFSTLLRLHLCDRRHARPSEPETEHTKLSVIRRYAGVGVEQRGLHLQCFGGVKKYDKRSMRRCSATNPGQTPELCVRGGPFIFSTPYQFQGHARGRGFASFVAAHGSLCDANTVGEAKTGPAGDFPVLSPSSRVSSCVLNRLKDGRPRKGTEGGGPADRHRWTIRRSTGAQVACRTGSSLHPAKACCLWAYSTMNA